MKAAYDAGINFFDTAEGYEGGASEIVMGKAIKKFGWKQQDLGYFDQGTDFLKSGNRLSLCYDAYGIPQIYFGHANARDPQNPLNNRGLSRKHVWRVSTCP